MSKDPRKSALDQTPDETVVISSLVVEVIPDSVDSAVEALNAMEGVEVHEVNGYKIVVTIEAPSSKRSHEIASSFLGISGVLNINLIYVNFEDEVLG